MDNHTIFCDAEGNCVYWCWYRRVGNLFIKHCQL